MRTCLSAPQGAPGTGARLVDRFGRVHDHARIAVTEQCNLRCVYCMPAEGAFFRKDEARLSSDELRRLVRVLAGLGVSRVRFTGGEPLAAG